MVLCYTGFPFILTESNMWNWIAYNLPHQCSTQVYCKDLSWVQFGSWYILATCLMLAMLLNSLSHPVWGDYVFSSFLLRPPPQRLLPLTKPFELNLRYLGQRIYRSGGMYWMTFLWSWPKVTAVASISKNLLFCMIKWEPLIRSPQNLVALLP